MEKADRVLSGGCLGQKMKYSFFRHAIIQSGIKISLPFQEEKSPPRCGAEDGISREIAENFKRSFFLLRICFVCVIIHKLSFGFLSEARAARYAGIAQPVEQLIRNQQVVCSSHITSSNPMEFRFHGVFLLP